MRTRTFGILALAEGLVDRFTEPYPFGTESVTTYSLQLIQK
jgi:hypothetical protein